METNAVKSLGKPSPSKITYGTRLQVACSSGKRVGGKDEKKKQRVEEEKEEEEKREKK